MTSYVRRVIAATVLACFVTAAGAAAAPPPEINYQGLFWNAPAGSESGWGINFAHQGEVIFATWFTYDATGNALWLSMTATRSAAGVYSGEIYQTRGPFFTTIPFSPTAVTATAVGMGTLTFSDVDNGRFAYVVNGIARTKAITRQVFGPVPTCTWGAQANLALATNYQDLWWAAPAGFESGWGVNFTHQGELIFATWFTYDVDGTALWLSATTAKTQAGPYTGTLYRTMGPPFNTVPFLPDDVDRVPVGTLTITFVNGNSATFTYALNGVMQTKSITRQVFRTPGTTCKSPPEVAVPDRFLSPPFAGEFPVVSWFDHQFPGVADRGIGANINTFGETVSTEDNHTGYDFGMPAGTPVLAAADGMVYFIREGFCIVSDNAVQIFHDRPSLQVLGYTTLYTHLSDVVVKSGQMVTAGQVIGHSAQGDRPDCHVFRAHMHFGVYRHMTGRIYAIDPYGWTGSGAVPADPWAAQPDGGPSFNLWRVAPRLFKQ